MKNEMFYGFEDTFKSLEELKQAMIDYIEYHNNSIITVKRKGLTPIKITTFLNMDYLGVLHLT